MGHEPRAYHLIPLETGPFTLWMGLFDGVEAFVRGGVGDGGPKSMRRVTMSNDTGWGERGELTQLKR